MHIFYGLVILLFIGLYAFTDHAYREYKTFCDPKIKSMEEQLSSLATANGELRDQLYQAFKQALRNEAEHLINDNDAYASYDPEELSDLITTYSYYTGIHSIADIQPSNFEKTVKIALYAKEGLLDYYQNYELYGDKVFRMDQQGNPIFLSEEEVAMVENNNFDFILKDLSLDTSPKQITGDFGYFDTTRGE